MTGHEDFSVDEFFGDELSEIERHHLLQRTVREGVDLQQELAKGGPFANYIKARRSAAAAALRALLDVEPTDAINIAKAQIIVREYLVAAEWIAGTLSDAEQARTTIKEDFTTTTDDDNQDDTDGGHYDD